RNTSSKPLDVRFKVNYMPMGWASVTRSLGRQQLRPFEARQINLSAALQSVDVKDLNGMMNLACTFTGRPGDLVMASGSVDQTGTTTLYRRRSKKVVLRSQALKVATIGSQLLFQEAFSM